jgi:hypothetical protein
MLGRILAVVPMAILLSSCAGGAFLAAPATGKVTGHVEVRVCGGAYRLDQPACQAHAAAGIVLSFHPVTASGTQSDGHATTDAKGAYTITLAPGTYSVNPATAEAYATGPAPQAFVGSAMAPRGFDGPRQVTVIAGKTVTADFAYLIELL